MMCVASSKHKSIRLARMWKKMSPGRGDCMARAGDDLAKGMQFRGPWRAEEFVPGVGAESYNTGKAGFDVAKLNGAHEPGETGAKVA